MGSLEERASRFSHYNRFSLLSVDVALSAKQLRNSTEREAAISATSLV